MNLSTVSCVLALLAATGLSSVSLHSANTFPIPDLDGSPCHPNVGSKQMGKKKSATNLHRTFMIVCVVLACIFSGFNYVTLYRHSTIQQQEREQEERRGSILDMKEIFLIKHHNTSIGSGNRQHVDDSIASPAVDIQHQDGFASNRTSNIVGNDGQRADDSITIPAVDIQNQDGFAICLLVKDDTERLAEWLAYHWLTLPLQYLVIAVDRTITSNPKPILDMWREETGMDITLWNDPDYRHVVNPTLNPKQKHRHRQRQFYAECMRYHKAKNHSWIALIDTDEFIANNDGYYRNSNGTQNLPILRNDQTLLDHLTAIQSQGNLQHLPIVDEKCHLMPRLAFSAVEDDPQIVQKANVENVKKRGNFDPMKFSTLRFYHHANPKDSKINKFGKVLVNLDKIEWEEINRKLRNVHRPLLESCGFPYHAFSDAALTVHHYVGTFEQYFAKDDGRRTKEIFNKLAFHDHGKNYQMQDWLVRFVDKVGVKRSERLLRTAGIIDHGKTMLMDMPDYPKDRTDKLKVKVPEHLRYFDEHGNMAQVQQV
jgi:hypothetical protein